MTIAKTPTRPRRCLDASEVPEAVHTEAHLRGILLAACGPGGAWARLPLSARHDPAVWSACRHLEVLRLVEATGDVRGDRTGFRATDRGNAACAAMLAIPPARPPKPRVRVPATAAEAPPANPTHSRRDGSR